MHTKNRSRSADLRHDLEVYIQSLFIVKRNFQGNNGGAHTTANKAQIDTLLTRDETFFKTQSKQEVTENLLQIIEYTKQSHPFSSEAKLVVGKKRTASEVENNSSEVDVAASAQSLRKIIPKQIKAQLVWKKTYKSGNATWKYQSVCPNAEVFQSLMRSEKEDFGD